MGRLSWPAFEAVATRFVRVDKLLERRRRERTAHRRERDELQASVEARADAWMASAPYLQIERIERYARADAYEVLELLVLAALDGDPGRGGRFADTVEIFAERVVANIRSLPPAGVRPPAGGVAIDAGGATGTSLPAA